MKIKATLVMITLALTPNLALAQGCSERMAPTISAASCAEGFVWDSITSTCIVQATS